MSFLTDLMGMGNAKKVMGTLDPSKWNYSAAQSNYGGPGNMLTGAINNMNESAANMNYKGNQIYGQGQQFLDPNSAFYQKQRGFLMEDVGQGLSEATRMQNQMLAARGVGQGGIRNMLGAANAGQVGEQVRRGSNDLYLKGMNTGTSLLGLGMQGLQGAGGLYGQAGSLGAGIDSRALQQSLANQAATNQARQFAAGNARDAWTMQYNDAAAQDRNIAGLWGGALGLAGSFLPIPKIG